AFRARSFGGDAMHRRRLLGDLDSGVSQPAAGLYRVAFTVDDSDVRRDDPRGLHVNARGLQVENAESVMPRVAHTLTLLPTTGMSRRADVQPVEALGGEGERDGAVFGNARELRAAEQVEQRGTSVLVRLDG